MLRDLLATAGAVDECGNDFTRPLEFGWMPIVVTLLVVLGSALANASGIGGGALWLPLFGTVAGFCLKAANSMSQAVIAAGAAGGVLFLVVQHHPEDERVPLIDFDLATILTPPLLFGVSLGVLFNIIFPDWLLVILLTLLLALLTYRPMKSGVRMWRDESLRKKRAQAQQESSVNRLGTRSDDPGGSGRDPFGNVLMQYNPTAKDATQRTSASNSDGFIMSDVAMDDVELGRPSNQRSLTGARKLLSAKSQRRMSHAAMEALSRSGAVSAFAYHADEESEFDAKFHSLMQSPLTLMDFSGKIPECFNAPAAISEDDGAKELLLGPIPGCFNSDYTPPGNDGHDAESTVEATGARIGRGAPSKRGGASESGLGNSVRPMDVQLPAPASRRQLLAQQAHGMGQLAVLWVILILLEYYKKTAPGGRCSGLFAGLYATQVAVVVLASTFAIVQVVRKSASADGSSVLSRGEEVQGESANYAASDSSFPKLARTACLTAVAGTVAGLFGIGGGMVMGPLMLELGVHPQVTAATSTFMVLFSSSAAVAQFAILGRINVQYSALFSVAAIGASVAGVSIVQRLVAMTGRKSVVILMLSGIIATGAVITLVTGSMKIASGGKLAGFQPFCR